MAYRFLYIIFIFGRLHPEVYNSFYGEKRLWITPIIGGIL